MIVLDEGKIIIKVPKALMKNMYEQGYLKRKLGTDLFLPDEAVEFKVSEEIVLEPKKATKIKETVDWIDEYRELFPKGLNQYSGRAYRGSRNECLRKMKHFVKSNKFTKETIIAATKLAIRKAAERDYQYFPGADYFINKQGSGSQLEAFCEFYSQGDLGEEERKNITAI